MFAIVRNGRGKTGTAKNGKIRLLFTDNEGLDNFNAFILKCYRSIETPLDFKAFLAASRKNLLRREIGEVWTFTSDLGNFTFISRDCLIDRGMTVNGILESIGEKSCV